MNLIFCYSYSDRHNYLSISEKKAKTSTGFSAMVVFPEKIGHIFFIMYMFQLKYNKYMD